MCALVPQLAALDGCPIAADTRGGVTNAMILDASAAMAQIREEIEDEERLEMCIMDSDGNGTSNGNNGNGMGNSYSNHNNNNGRASGMAGRHGGSSPAVGGEPDTGSELTHGSDVVLAGGVAAAMRRRRAATRAADPSGGAGPGAGDARNSYDSTASDGGSKAYGALDTLSANAASAIQRRNSPSHDSDPGGNSFLQEGDLTVSMLGHQPRPGTAGGGRPGSSSSPRPSTSKKDGSGSQFPTLPPASPKTGAKRASSKGKLSLDLDSAPDSALPSATELFGRQSANGGRPPRSPLLSGSSPRAASPYQHNETRPSTTMSSGRPMSTYSSCSDEGNTAANLSELAYSAPSAPFKVSVPLAMRGDDLVALRSRLAPQAAEDSDDEGAYEDRGQEGDRGSSASSGRRKESSLRVSTARQSASQADIMDLNEYENERQETGRKRQSQAQSQGQGQGLLCSGSGERGAEEAVDPPEGSQVKGIALLKGKGQATSIVHRDVVKRRNNRCAGSDDGDDEEEDDEDIWVDHSSRHSLMVTRGRGKGSSAAQSSPSAASRGARLGADLMAQMAGSGVGNSGISGTGAGGGTGGGTGGGGGGEKLRPRMGTFGLGGQGEGPASSRPPVAPAGGPTLSSIAGRSLGFDLSGSLAAINQWVEDMDTGGSSDEDGEAPVIRGSGGRIPASVGVHSSFQSEDDGEGRGEVRGSHLICVSGGGEEKTGTIPASTAGNTTTTTTTNAAAAKEERSDSSSHGSHGSASRSYGSSTREILSRQKILSMCVGKDDRDADDSSLDNDILFVDVASGLAHSTGCNAGSPRNGNVTSPRATTTTGTPSHSSKPPSQRMQGQGSLLTLGGDGGAGGGRRGVEKTTSVTKPHTKQQHQQQQQKHIISVTTNHSSQSHIDSACDVKVASGNARNKPTAARVHSAVDYEGASEDDDEGDLNDLYAENLRLLADPSGLTAKKPAQGQGDWAVAPNNGPAKSNAISSKPAVLKSNRNSHGALANIDTTTDTTTVKQHRSSSSSPKGPTPRGLSPAAADGASAGDAGAHGAVPGPTGSSSTVNALGESSGEGVKLSDSELVDMLNRPPKTTYALRTKSNFQEFFRGMSSDRMLMLLEKAYAGEETEDKRRDKVDRRMGLLRDVLV
jgi:hypothetical protein